MFYTLILCDIPRSLCVLLSKAFVITQRVRPYPTQVLSTVFLIKQSVYTHTKRNC